MLGGLGRDLALPTARCGSRRWRGDMMERGWFSASVLCSALGGCLLLAQLSHHHHHHRLLSRKAVAACWPCLCAREAAVCVSVSESQLVTKIPGMWSFISRVFCCWH